MNRHVPGKIIRFRRRASVLMKRKVALPWRGGTDHLPMRKLEQFERRILTELQRDGRLTNQELAELVNLSPSACWRRVKALEASGVIRRYTALVEPAAVGVGECVFAHISLERHTDETTNRFVEAVRQRPEVLECYATTGEADYLLRVMVPDVAAYEHFLRDFVFSLPGIAKVHSNFALKEIKQETALPVGYWSENEDARTALANRPSA